MSKATDDPIAQDFARAKKHPDFQLIRLCADVLMARAAFEAGVSSDPGGNSDFVNDVVMPLWDRERHAMWLASKLSPRTAYGLRAKTSVMRMLTTKPNDFAGDVCNECCQAFVDSFVRDVAAAVEIAAKHQRHAEWEARHGAGKAVANG